MRSVNIIRVSAVLFLFDVVCDEACQYYLGVLYQPVLMYFISTNISDSLHVRFVHRGRRGCDRVVVRFITTNAISAYHH